MDPAGTAQIRKIWTPTHDHPAATQPTPDSAFGVPPDMNDDAELLIVRPGLFSGDYE
jgi:hypothetical protein